MPKKTKSTKSVKASSKRTQSLPVGNVTLMIVTAAVLFGVASLLLIKQKMALSNTEDLSAEIERTWRDSLRCQSQQLPDTSNWQTYSSDTVTFKYPKDWELNTKSHNFQAGDIVELGYSETNDQTYPGGGGYMRRGAGLTFAKPLTISNRINLEKWLEQNLLSQLKLTGHLDLRPNRNLEFGGLKAIGLYVCGEHCANHVYATKNGHVYGMMYSVVEDYRNENGKNFRSELCGVLSTVTIK